MKTYCLKENTDDGSIDLIETRPVVLATFQTRDLADRVLAMMMETPAAAAAIAAPSLATMKPIAPEKLEAGLEVIKNMKAIAPEVDEAPASSEPAPEDWAAAFQALKGGANMDEVAKTLGVSFHQLRGKYAAWSRSQKTRHDADIDMENCRMCGREFVVSAASDGLCARCRA